MSIEQVSDHVLFVLLAYLAAFMPWTFLASKDFIGPRWKTVRGTYISGRNHAIFTFFTACYVVAYIVIQGLSKDYKEMSAAIVAFSFSLLNFLRTVWGLWQLQYFREWAINSINALKAMGVRYRLKETGRSEKRQNTAAGDQVTTLVDGLLVNETIVDNQIAHGETRCFLKYRGIELQSGTDDGAPVVRHLRSVWHWLRIVTYLLLDCGMRIFGKTSRTQIQMVPLKPVEVWLNWSVAFAAQGLGQWISDFSTPRDPKDDPAYEDLTAKERWEKRAQFFGSQLVSSAWLQLWPETGLGEGLKTTCPFHWHGVWDEKTRMNDGVAMKEELLKMATTSGIALPFGTPSDTGYYAYRRQLNQAVIDLPVLEGFDNVIEGFDIEKLEWLTILLYIGTTAREKGGRFCEVVSDRASSIDGDVSDRAPSIDSSGSDDNNDDEEITDDAQALSNLRTQVYLSRSSGSPDEMDLGLQRTSNMFNCLSVHIPQVSKVFSSTENRHVSKVGEMIDVWMSLLCGDQIGFVVRLNGSSFWEDVCSSEYISTLHVEGPESFPSHVSKAVQAIHAEIEKRRVFHNFVNDENWTGSCDQFLTFMGYGMETVRSRLGHWVLGLHNQGIDGSKEEFYPLMDGLEDVDVSVELGQELSQVLLENVTISNWSRRVLQTRFLWELQRELAKDERMGPRSAKLICLCILSFPSICIEVEKGDMESVRSERENECVRVNLWNCCDGEVFTDAVRDGSSVLPQMKIYAECGPQPIHVIGTFSKQEKTLSVKLHLRASKETKRFKWVLWRDAFLGRLEGLKEWQDEHGIRSADLRMTEGEMKAEVKIVNAPTGERVVRWAGWKPFRFEIMRFELESDGLLKEQFEEERNPEHLLQSLNAMKNEERKEREGLLLAWQGKVSLYWSLGSITRRQVAPVDYTIASAPVLRHALFVVEQAFNSARTGGRGTAGIRPSNALLEDAKTCMRNDWERAVSLLEFATSVDGNEEAFSKCIDVLMKQNKRKRNLAWRAVCLLEGFFARICSGRWFGLESLLSKCLEVMERFGDESTVTSRLSCLLTHIWTINQGKFGKRTFVALQNMYSMHKDVTALEALSLVLYDEFSSGNMNRRWGSNVEAFTGGRELMRVTPEHFVRSIVRDGLKVCERFHLSLEEKPKGRQKDRQSGSLRLQARVRLWTLKALTNGYTKENHEESAALCREVSQDRSSVGLFLMMGSWAAVVIEGKERNDQNEIEIEKMCDFSIEQGNAAMFALAHALCSRADIPICNKKAKDLYRRAIDAGNDDAMYCLANMLTKRRAIDAGNDSIINLANLLADGAGGV